MIAGGMLRRSFWGRGRGGRGSAPSLAQRSRSRLQFAERQTLAAIVDRNFSGFVLPHQHAVCAAIGRPDEITSTATQSALLLNRFNRETDFRPFMEPPVVGLLAKYGHCG